MAAAGVHSPFLVSTRPEPQETATAASTSSLDAIAETRQQLQRSEQRMPSPLHRMASATLGAVLTSLIVTPFDVVKVRMQSLEIATPGSMSTSARAPPSSQSSSSTATNASANLTKEASKYATKCRYYAFDSDVLLRSSAATSGLQQRSVVANVATTAGSSSGAANPRVISGTLDGMIKIAQSEGLAGLWRGLSPTLVMSIPSTVIYYVGYEHLRESFRTSSAGTGTEPYAPLFAGAISRIASATAISPIELVRTRMQAGDKSAMEIIRGVAHLVGQNGIGSLYRGLASTLWRDVPFSAMYWIGYESLKQRFVHYNSIGNVTNEFSASFLAGLSSGMVAAILTHPFDVAKTIQQVAHAESSNSRQASTSSTRDTPISLNMATVFRGVIAQSGWRGLFIGLVPRVAKVAPACAIMISTYEFGKTIFADLG